jgi:trigger factor
MTENEKDLLEESQPDAEQVTSEPEEEAYKWEEPPRFEIEHKEDCLCEVKVTIPVVNIKTALDAVYDEVNDGMQVPGFRRGKAPRKLLEKRLGKYARTTAVDRLVDAASQKLVKENDNIKPVSKVDVQGLENVESMPLDQDLAYTLNFETAGNCELADYTQIELEKPEYDVDQSDIDGAIENMRMRFGRYEPLTEGAAQDGDQVIIDFTGAINGEPFEGNSAENYPYILGTKRFHENMEAAIKGAKPGEQVEAEVPFPEDYREASLSGKTAQFQIKVNEIKRRVLPELNDEFAKKVGYDSVAELQEGTRKRIAENTDTQVSDLLRDQAMAKLIEASSFTLPKGQIQHFVDNEYNTITERLTQQHVPAEEIEKQKDEIQAAADKQGLFMLKSMYAINEVCEKEHIEVTEADFETYARTLASGDEQQFEVMKQYLEQEEVRSSSAYRILTAKALDVLVSKAKIKLVPLADANAEEPEQEEKQDA